MNKMDFKKRFQDNYNIIKKLFLNTLHRQKRGYFVATNDQIGNVFIMQISMEN